MSSPVYPTAARKRNTKRQQKSPSLQMSFFVLWSGWRDSNSRPLAPHASALPGCATPRIREELYRSVPEKANFFEDPISSPGLTNEQKSREPFRQVADIGTSGLQHESGRRHFSSPPLLPKSESCSSGFINASPVPADIRHPGAVQSRLKGAFIAGGSFESLVQAIHRSLHDAAAGRMRDAFVPGRRLSAILGRFSLTRAARTSSRQRLRLLSTTGQ